jgi:hypothetical protein
MVAHTTLEALTILIIPHEDWFNELHPLINPHPNNQVLANLDSHISTYFPQIVFPTYLALGGTLRKISKRGVLKYRVCFIHEQ